MTISPDLQLARINLLPALEKLQVNELWPRLQRMIVTNETESVGNLLLKFGKNEISATPVCHGQVIVGLVNLHDILSMGHKQHLFTDANPAFFEMPVKKFLDSHGKTAVVNYFVQLDRLVPVECETRIISQLDLVRFLYDSYQSKTVLDQKFVKFMFETMDLPQVTRLSSGATSRVIAVDEDDTFERCFDVMFQNGIRAIPVIDSENRLLSAVTENDLCRLNAASLDLLKEQVGRKHATTVPFNAHLGDCCQKMVDERAHYCFLVDEQKHLEGVVTPSDILSLFLSEDQ
ncbi:hypothetical protein EDD86DRAFT_248669 [Gorgonomyces haynaldii]|nr:hypothetical protein EDD86DRAFT_248669 [Gorgonomyces haynaldii]